MKMVVFAQRRTAQFDKTSIDELLMLLPKMVRWSLATAYAARWSLTVKICSEAMNEYADTLR